MKKLGLIILGVGIVILVFAFFGGINFVTKEKVIDLGPIEMMADKNHSWDWSPYLGVGIMALGFIIYLVGLRSKQF